MAKWFYQPYNSTTNDTSSKIKVIRGTNRRIKVENMCRTEMKMSY